MLFLVFIGMDKEGIEYAFLKIALERALDGLTLLELGNIYDVIINDTYRQIIQEIINDRLIKIEEKEENLKEHIIRL